MGLLPVRQKCTDIDECTKFPGLCKGNLHCTNTVGSYLCGCRQGYDTVIINDFTLMKRVPGCADIDECNNQEICPKNSICKNFAGDYICECHIGFEGDLCEDIDECLPISSCHTNATCLNSHGSYKCSCTKGFYGDGKTCKIGQCDDRRCPTDQICVSPTSNECVCEEGLTYDEKTKVCEDVNECLLDNDCDQSSVCTNSKRSYSCSCKPGYFGNGKTCQVGSCTEDVCSVNEECVSPTGIDCRCKNGFELDDTQICVDIDECASKDSCDENANCLNTDGSYECRCRQGFFGDGMSCFKGSCSSSNCPKNQKCVSPTTVDCECIDGFMRNDLSVCVDIDECQKKPCAVNAECLNTEGTYSCSCNTGFTGNGFLCSDSNECTTNAHNCSYNAKCINTKGSFTCSCDRGVGPICTSQWIFIFQQSKSPYDGQIIDGNGQSKEINFNFTLKVNSYSGGFSMKSCSIVWHGEIYLFGGCSGPHDCSQILVVDQCKLTNKGKLDFTVKSGACAQRNDAEVFICFENDDDPETHRNCHRSNGPLEKFSKLPDSTHRHRRTHIAVTSGNFSVFLLETKNLNNFAGIETTF